jgi:hypothetical protein
MDVIPVLGKNFNLVVPIFIIVLAVLQGLNVFNRILMSLHLGFLQFGDPPISKKDLDEVSREAPGGELSVYAPPNGRPPPLK